MSREHGAAPVDADPRTVVERALLGQAHAILEPAVASLVAGFYLGLEHRSGPRRVLERLTPEERERLVQHQAAHVLRVLHPDTTPAEILEAGRRMGRVHARTGVEMDWYVEAVADHQRGIYSTLLPHRESLDCAAATAALNERFMLDLHATLQGYRDVDRAESAILLQVTRVCAEARTIADLVEGVLQALLALDGMSASFMGRPDESGTFVFEAGAGDGVDDFLAHVAQPGSPVMTSSGDSSLGQGPSGRAWRSGEIVRSDDYRRDPTTAPWREWSMSWGWRASAAVPLCSSQRRPIALLSLYASHVGYFAYPSRLALLEQVRHIVERALEELEVSPAVASAVRSYSDRRQHVELLESGCLEMHFQPVVSLRTGRLVKLEALARLRDSGRLLSPPMFLPTFGDDELLRLFEVGLEQSLAAVAGLEAEGIVCGVSLNLPVASMTDERYAAAVADALAGTAVAAEQLTLELLETGDVVGSLAKRRAAMDRFKELGVRLAQDDLGSGYSSLLRLRHFPFDEAKIDKNLVRGTDMAPRAALHFVQPITDIAHSLGLSVVLEGLESDGLVEAALQLGVDGGQGYAIGRPMPLSEVAAWHDGYRLELHRDHPRTDLGALAAHVAWEHRVTAVGDDPAREVLLAREACALTSYVAARAGDRAGIERAHDEVHRTAVAGRGSAEHRTSWERLVTMVGES